ncbi:MAG TPA: hypothetical protein VF459_11945 [Caulobacteraceae bacterium]
MHPFPPADELSFLVGEELTQIILNPFGITFNFASGRAIVCDEAFDFVDGAGASSNYPCCAAEAPPIRFYSLLQSTVVALAREELRLMLRFDSGMAIVFHSVLGPYESGQIHFGRFDDEDRGKTLKLIVF